MLRTKPKYQIGQAVTYKSSSNTKLEIQDGFMIDGQWTYCFTNSRLKASEKDLHSINTIN